MLFVVANVYILFNRKQKNLNSRQQQQPLAISASVNTPNAPFLNVGDAVEPSLSGFVSNAIVSELSGDNLDEVVLIFCAELDV
jgi:hypothetical protein